MDIINMEADKFKRAKKAINELTSDLTLSIPAIRDYLAELREDIDIYIEALQHDIDANLRKNE